MQQKPTTTRLELELLEGRQMLTAHVTLTTGGILQIDGTPQADTVRVYQQGLQVVVQSSSAGDRAGTNGTTRWDLTKVRGLLFHGGDGNDGFTDDTTIPCTLYGGNGNDTLTGGDGADQLFGESGDDKLYGRGGDDTVYGGQGADCVNGGTGRNALYGGDLLKGAWNGRDSGRADTFWNDYDPKLPVYDGISPNDVFQDSPPSCALVAALAAAARVQMPLAKGIKYQGNNLFQVRLTGSDGQPTYQTVFFDGTWTDNDPQPARDTAGRQVPEFWTILYQRAYLQQMDVDWKVTDPTKWVSRTGKLWQSPQVALFTVTGWDAGWVSANQASPQQMRRSVWQGEMMIALTNSTSVAPGLVPWHCYTLLDVYQQNGIWQVKLRNPWGTLDDASATGSLLDGRADGIVTIPWPTFVANFQGFAVA